MNEQGASDSEFLPRLAIYVAWHPAFAQGRQFAENIYSHFARDPDHPNARGLGIPVFFRSALAEGKVVPPPIELDQARHTAAIVLVDPKLVIGGPAWQEYVAGLWHGAERAPERHRVFPVAIAPSAFNILPESHFIRLYEYPPEAATGILLNRLTNELARLLTQRPTLASAEAGAVHGAGPPKMRLFLSHAKIDGEKAAKALRGYIHDHLALDTFFDAIDIAVGFRFEDQINEGIDGAAFAIIHTDAYASRVWCQHEVIRAKRRGHPVVVVHAIEKGEARSFPYLGNVPTIRWRPDDPARLEMIVGLVLREVLRSEYFERDFEDLRALFNVPSTVRALPRAPELLTALALRQEAERVPFFVYPDPPLTKQELDLVLELAPDLRLTTPTLLFANPARPERLGSAVLDKTLAGKRIGISISESENLAERGFGFPKLPEEKKVPESPQLRDAMGEFARFFLAAGAGLSYGGDLRQGGFTMVLFELLAGYRAMSGERTPAVQSYLSWPIYLDLTETQEADWAGLVDFHKVPPPGDLNVDPNVKAIPNSPQNCVAWARSLTAMRERMNEEIDARLFIGGQIGSLGVRGLGRYPGLAEEASLTLRAEKPVFLIGAFGGCTEAIISALRGEKPRAFSEVERLSENSVRAAFDLYNGTLRSNEEPIDYETLTADFESIGVSGLNNGLSKGENDRLFSTQLLPEMIALVLRGLERISRA